jgi:hypothetical protein
LDAASEYSWERERKRRSSGWRRRGTPCKRQLRRQASHHERRSGAVAFALRKMLLYSRRTERLVTFCLCVRRVSSWAHLIFPSSSLFSVVEHEPPTTAGALTRAARPPPLTLRCRSPSAVAAAYPRSGRQTHGMGRRRCSHPELPHLIPLASRTTRKTLIGGMQFCGALASSASQKIILWRTRQGAPQKYNISVAHQKTMRHRILVGPTPCQPQSLVQLILWRTRPDAPQN